MHPLAVAFPRPDRPRSRCLRRGRSPGTVAESSPGEAHRPCRRAPRWPTRPARPSRGWRGWLIREWALPVEEVEVGFPPPAEIFAVNPLGQVPVLTVDGEAVFPTLMILERLWSMAGSAGEAYDGARDRQLLLTILSAGDALVAAFYQRWAGLGPVGPNAIGYDPAERNLARVRSTLDWLEANPRMAALGAAVTPPAMALACLLLWTEARGGLGWPVPPGLAAIVRRAATSARASGLHPSARRPAAAEPDAPARSGAAVRHQEMPGRLGEEPGAVVLPGLDVDAGVAPAHAVDPRAGIGVARQAGAQVVDGEVDGRGSGGKLAGLDRAPPPRRRPPSAPRPAPRPAP